MHALGERDRDGGLHILATDRRARLLAETAGAPAASARRAPEYVGEDVGRIEPARAGATAAATAAVELEIVEATAAAAAR